MAAKPLAFEAADAAASAVSMGAILGILALAPAAIVAWFGGVAGPNGVP